MATTSKSPRTVAITALTIGQKVLPDYAHRCSPRTYTQPQLFACLVLMRFHRTDFRGIVAILADNPTLCEELGLTCVPHYTTLHKAQQRLLRFAQVRQLIGASLKSWFDQPKPIAKAAADGTGFESSRISPYFVRRRDRSSGKSTTSYYTRFPKLQTIVDCDTHLILAAWPTRGPTPDVHQLDALQAQLAPGITIQKLFADAGYDSEFNHKLLREYLGIVSIIPPRAASSTVPK